MPDSALGIARIARVIGDSSRAEMLSVLMDGRAWTSRELARAANVTPATASAHLKLLVRSALLRVVPQGRHRYYRIASAEVAQAIESLMALAGTPAPRHATARALDTALRRARTCYDHLAGTLGVTLAEALRKRGAVEVDDRGARLSADGAALLAELRVTYDAGGHRPPCRLCLDWSERRWHLAGRVGAALLTHALEAEWVRRKPGTRAFDVTERGVVAFREAFGVAAAPSAVLPNHEVTEC